MSPLIGRKYVYGEQDCYTLVRDYYSLVLQIDFPSPPHYHFLPAGNMDLIQHHFKEAGFTKTSVPQENDLIIMSCNSKTPNHMGIFLESKYILHHCEKRLSSKDNYGNAGYWDKQTTFYLRHIDLM